MRKSARLSPSKASTKKSKRLPDTYGSPTYFFDATNDCASIAEALRAEGRKVVQFHQLFKDRETPDRVWMAEVCSRGYIVITKDKDLLAKSNSLMIWHRAKGRIIQLASGTANREQLIHALIRALRKSNRRLIPYRRRLYCGYFSAGELKSYGRKT